MSRRWLITGATGFAGGHLAELLAREGDEAIGLARAAEPDRELRERLAGYASCDLRDAAATRAAVRDAAPERVVHLAAAASVAESWRRPRETAEHNLATALSLLEAVRAEAPAARVVIAGSGEVYGPAPPPIAEDAPLRPQSPYALGKASADLAAGLYADAHGLHVVRTRAFNHAGPGQSDAYVVSSFARQIAVAEAAGRREAVLETGDLRPRRDFTDVRDVVRAYRLAAEAAEPGVYNVCSGSAVAIGDILAGLASAARVAVEQRTDPGLLREHEVMELRGSHDRLTAATGWSPEIPLERTLADALGWWRSQAGAESAR